MDSLSQTDRLQVGAPHLNQLSMMCVRASKLTNIFYKRMKENIHHFGDSVAGARNFQLNEEIVQRRDPSGQAWKYIQLIINQPPPTLITFDCIGNLDEDSQTRCKRTATFRQLVVSFCVLDTFLSSIYVQAEKDSNTNRTLTSAGKVILITKLDETFSTAMNEQPVSFTQLIDRVTQEWGWVLYETQRSQPAETFPVLRSFALVWKGSEYHNLDPTQLTGGYEWCTQEELFRIASTVNTPADALLFFISRLSWKVMDHPGCPTVGNLRAAIAASAKFLFGKESVAFYRKCVENIGQ